MPDSLQDWKRVPTTASALFGIDLPYRPPKSALGKFVWRKRLWVETTFALSVLEPWEKIFILSLTYFLLTLVFTGLLTLVPQQLPLLYGRLLYYIHGHETAPNGLALQFASNSSLWTPHNALVAL